MRKKGIKPALPENPAPYLTDWLFEIGPGVSSGNGLVEIGWNTLTEWQRIMGVELLPWEARILRQLSREYVGQWYDSRKPDCPAPYAGTKGQIAANRENVAHQVRAMFRAVADEPKQGLARAARKR